MCNKSSGIYVPVENVPSDQRLKKLKTTFNEIYHENPSFYVRVPGRVNIIGEHIDYCGYPVLPMAINQDITIAAKVTAEPLLQIRNINPLYKSFKYDFAVSKDIVIKADSNGKPLWYNYVLCGIKGAIEYLNDKFRYGIQIIIDGNVPPASGLSSSSALVSAACLSFIYGHEVSITKSEIASLCAKCERYIGTQGGGMDQAIAFLAEKYCAQYITWQPLNATPVLLPEDAVFVVANSLAEANKAATNDFNQRVMECRLAAKILAESSKLKTENKILTLSEIQSLLGYNLEDMVTLVQKCLTKDTYTKDEISDILNIKKEDLENKYLTSNTKHINEFKLRQRALHVYQEAMRVEEFTNICVTKCNQNGDNGIISRPDYLINEARDEILKKLGTLMLDSHESLKTQYECSHENLDLLVEISKKNNVFARLTGAGWGGCIVALCSKDQVQDYVNALKKEFYDKKNCNGLYSNSVFITTPSRGAIIYTP